MQPLRTASVGAPEGGWQLRHRPPTRAGGLPAWLAIPRKAAAERPAIVAVHGIGRGAREQAMLIAPAASDAGHMVIAPLYDAVVWKRYQQVVVQGRADLALLALLADIAREYPAAGGRFILAGFSGGAQFAHRFAMLHPERVERVVAASAGWYTFPAEAPFPYGLGDGPDSVPWGATLAGNLDRFLRIPIDVCVGAWDDGADKTLRRGEAIDREQGVGRLTRGRRWTHAINAAAVARGLSPRVSFHSLPRCGHVFANCVRVGGLAHIIAGSAR